MSFILRFFTLIIPRSTFATRERDSPKAMPRDTTPPRTGGRNRVVLKTPCSFFIVSDKPRARQSSVFGKWRRKEGPQELVEDEWFIPYNRQSTQPPAQIHEQGLGQGGIGQMPTTYNSSISQARSRGHTKTNSESKSRTIFPRRPAFPRSGSDGSLSRPPPFAIAEERERIPSTTSVPTGLTAPKMLFSPLSREMRDESQDHQPRYPSRRAEPTSNFNATAGPSSYKYGQDGGARNRSVSMPKHGHVYDRADMRRWAAPTMCDMLVFPRPQITALTITPPGSPNRHHAGNLSTPSDRLSPKGNGNDISQVTIDREKEREEWQKYGERSRTKSFRRERDRDFPRATPTPTQALSRKGSLSKEKPPKTRSRAASFGEVILGSSRRKEKGKGKEKENWDDEAHKSAPPAITNFAFASPRAHHREGSMSNEDFGLGGGGDLGYEQKQSQADSWRRRHQHSKSSPDLTQRQRVVRMAPSPPESKSVVVIGPGPGPATGRSPGKIPPRTSSKMDFTKPLPPLPDEYRLRYNPSSPFKPFERIGVALSPDRVPSPAPVAGRQVEHGSSRTKTPTTINADDPFIEHPPGTPTSPLSRADTSASSATARAMLAKQHQRAVNRRAFNSPRPRQRESTSGSGTGPGTGTVPMTGSTTSSFYSQNSQRASAISAVSPLRRLTAMEEAIGRSRAASVGDQSVSGPGSRQRTSSGAPPNLGAPIAAGRQLLSPHHGAWSPRGASTSPDPSSDTTPRVRKVSLDSNQTPSPRNPGFENFQVCLLLAILSCDIAVD